MVLVAAAALLRGSELLCAQRSAPPELAGLWEFPGGKVEDGEEPRSAAHRELAEELGIEVELGELVVGPNADGSWPVLGDARMLVWRGEVVGGSPAALQDHADVRWVELAEAHTLAWIEVDRPILAALIALAGEESVLQRQDPQQLDQDRDDQRRDRQHVKRRE